jgi:hypothetical protein
LRALLRLGLLSLNAKILSTFCVAVPHVSITLPLPSIAKRPIHHQTSKSIDVHADHSYFC